jgi:hypothetical protein
VPCRVDRFREAVLRAALLGHQHVEDLLACDGARELQAAIDQLAHEGVVALEPAPLGHLLVPGPLAASELTAERRRPPS